MNYSELRELLTQFDESSVRFIDLTNGDFHLVLNKDKAEFVQPTVPLAVSAPVNVEESTVSEPIAQDQVTETAPVVTTAEQITSPLVGVAYLKPAPDQPVFKSVGDSVKKGDVLCIVEAMKVMNEIVSDRDGVIVEINIENEEVVEYGQALFTVQ
ncbi:acetyl-CoA carboxylase biotin carboxyl carrier protein [Vagococcus xieshaowenii]|uniref:Biotin carboxyl carrier protein of acetyl-CoA carboxylase n=1 Tax=Vagococcus xieshaowenii TaxID=2562451 RepID=A0A4Z0DBV5_9ENTE|nr:acetyl-CoA carboxylase biotin carboxyl carrier protein [Vagococcus xieshaowenii]QCA28334.1 acetyl-CoA carboxylase biotin carboxyl carrier protein [Vagococcus xieshaowenii]TFZ42278.1 acetyl-CoA carboxylase biotin carboxyl carrier protein [Vagococcus xieshaowenii]